MHIECYVRVSSNWQTKFFRHHDLKSSESVLVIAIAKPKIIRSHRDCHVQFSTNYSEPYTRSAWGIQVVLSVFFLVKNSDICPTRVSVPGELFDNEIKLSFTVPLVTIIRIQNLVIFINHAIPNLSVLADELNGSVFGHVPIPFDFSVRLVPVSPRSLDQHPLRKVVFDRNVEKSFGSVGLDWLLIDRLVEPFKSLLSGVYRELYTEAVKILEASAEKFEFPVAWGQDLQSEHERYLTEKHVGRPVVVTDYPKDIKAFYMRLNDDERTVAAMDVLVPGVGEIIGGSQREERLAVLDARMNNDTLKEHLWWYRDLRRYGTVPHAGFGLGFERLLMYATGMENIRDAIPFPRVPNNAQF